MLAHGDGFSVTRTRPSTAAVSRAPKRVFTANTNRVASSVRSGAFSTMPCTVTASSLASAAGASPRGDGP